MQLYEQLCNELASTTEKIYCRNIMVFGVHVQSFWGFHSSNHWYTHSSNVFCIMVKRNRMDVYELKSVKYNIVKQQCWYSSHNVVFGVWEFSGIRKIVTYMVQQAARYPVVLFFNRLKENLSFTVLNLNIYLYSVLFSFFSLFSYCMYFSHSLSLLSNPRLV